jgi:hypothetical protein
MWQDHDLGSYPTIGVWWEFDPPWDYIRKCEFLLEKFNYLDFWVKIHPEQVYGELAIFDEDKEREEDDEIDEN